MKPVKTEIMEWGIMFTFADGSYCKKHYDGNEYWYNKENELHRGNDQPAVIGANGIKYWMVNGKHHRDNDQPAIIYADGSKSWYINGKSTRTEKLGDTNET